MRRRLACALAALLCTQPAAWCGRAAAATSFATEAERALESRVKAAFLFRFIEFVTWPDTAFPRSDAPFVIAVVARDTVANELRSITAGRQVAGHAIEVKRASDVDAIAGAHLVFIGESERQRVRDWARVAPRHALLVTESEAALTQGSVINFVVADGRVRFEISLEAAEKRGLRMSSRLLAVAQYVRTAPP